MDVEHNDIFIETKIIVLSKEQKNTKTKKFYEANLLNRKI